MNVYLYIYYFQKKKQYFEIKEFKMSVNNSKNLFVAVGSIKVRVIKDVITDQQVRLYFNYRH